MISYLVKFNSLPKELRDKVSSPSAMAMIGALEKKYAVSLASVVMKVMIKELSVDKLADFFAREFNYESKRANELVSDLRANVFVSVGDYLGIAPAKSDLKMSPFPVPLDETPHYYTTPKTTPVTPEEKSRLDKWLNERKAEIAPHSNGFFFSPEDEEEVQKLAKRVAGFTPDAQKKLSVEDGLKAVTKEAGISFTSEDMKKRFEQVMKTYLHGIRNRVDTKQTLIKSVEVGGLGIDSAQADKILQVANKYRNEPEKPTVEAPRKIVTQSESDSEKKGSTPIYVQAAPRVSGRGDVEYDFGALIRGEGLDDEAKKREAEMLKNKPVEEKKEVEPLSREKSYMAEEKEATEEKDERDEFIDLTKLENLKNDRTIDVGKQMRASSKISGNENGADISIIQARAAANTDGKIKMEDVRYIPKLTGPIDELREMSILNFRRLSPNPREAALKVKKKISFLEEESFTKRFEGIKAWRQSPVNKLYLEIGQESIINKSPVDAIIRERRLSRKPALTTDEFMAVMDLNKDLRF